jgi:hypothetical protein
MKSQLLLFVLSLCCFFCASQKKEIIGKSTIKIEGRNTNIRDLLEIDGYYTRPDYPHYGSIMFFEDGTWVYFFFKRDLSENEIRANMSESVTSWIKNKRFQWGSYWGVYKREGDTIIVYRYDQASFWKGWSLSEERYKVIDREIIQRIYWRSLLKSSESSYEFHSPWIYGDNLQFTPAESLPTPDNWLKEEKWIWRNEKDWEEYKNKIKKK